MTKELSYPMKQALKKLEKGPARIPDKTANALLRRGLIEEAELPIDIQGARRRALIALGTQYYKVRR